MIVAVPQAFVVKRIPVVKCLEIGRKRKMKLMVVIYFVQGFEAVGFKIPKGMVEVEEEMAIHDEKAKIASERRAEVRGEK